MSYQQPPVVNNSKREKRKVGFELEFAGIELQETAEIIASLYGGTIQEEHRYYYEVEDTSLGTFRVELDAQILQKMARQNEDFSFDEQSIRKSIEDVVDKLAKTVVPIEVVMPPLPVAELEKLEKLRQLLQESKAEGTDTSFVHAFGMHINVEVPELSAESVLRYLQAFIVVYPWLLDVLKIDISRKISPYVDSYPDRYSHLVLDPSYQPSFEQMIKDYVEYNNTRNRPLDMMPIFGMVDNELIREAVRGEKNEPRPAFHYRLPNSRINDSGWSFEAEWNKWIVVEKLAADKVMLDKLCRLYLLRRNQKVISFGKEWAETIRILLGLDEE